MTLGFKLDFFLNPKKKSCLVRKFIRILEFKKKKHIIYNMSINFVFSFCLCLVFTLKVQLTFKLTQILLHYT